MSYYQRYVDKYDDGKFNPSVKYTGPFWIGEGFKSVLGQNEDINYLSFLHDNAYERQIESSKKVDHDYREAIIEKTGMIEVAETYHYWINKMNFISWYYIKIRKFFKGL